MSNKLFKHYDLTLIEPPFDSQIVNYIIDLDKLRDRQLGGSTPALTFFQLKHIFHLLESIGSARIEGNNTTVAEYIETKLTPHATESENIKEIHNIENAMSFVEENINSTPINRAFISELHKKVVDGLNTQNEGDRYPGEYRKIEVSIKNADHSPPTHTAIPSYMDELFDFINSNHNSKYDLLKVAIAHHRFAWIHPFSNGNGRTVRLLTYAMLVKMGFNVNTGRILNPTAVFCSDRDAYYQHLSQADRGTDQCILNWCEYVLEGLKTEIEKIDKLSNYPYLKKEILIPAISHAVEREYLTKFESQVLMLTVEKEVIQASDLKALLPGKSPTEISREIRKLIDKKKLLIPVAQKARKYVICFDHSYLFRSIMWALGKKGFLPNNDAEKI